MSSGAGVIRVSLVAAVLVGAGLASTVHAQQNEAVRRQQMFETLLTALIESQLNTLNQQQQPTGPGTTATPVSNERVSTQLREVRQVSNALSQELSRFFEVLNQDMRQRPSLTTHFNSTLQVNASASVLAKRSESVRNLEDVKRDFVDLHRDWQQLAYQLEGSNGQLSTGAQTSIRTINTHMQRLAGLFGVQETSRPIDTVKFQRLSEALELALKNLMDDISMELGWTDQTRQLLTMGRMVEQQARFMAYSSELARNRDRAVSEYEKFHQLWDPFAAKLWPLHNRFIERSLQRIQQIDRELQETLLIPIKVDHRQLARLNESLQADAKRLFEQSTLADLIVMKNPEGLIRNARDFQAANNQMLESARRKRDTAQLQTEFRKLEQQWKLLHDNFQGTTSPELLRLVKGIEQNVESLKVGVQIRSSFDRNRALQLIASIENYAKHLQDDFSSYVVQGGRYDRAFTFQALHTCHQFSSFSNNIHQSLADGADPASLRDQVDILSRGWTYLNSEFLSKLQGAERVQMSRLASEITPQIVQFQTMFEF